MLKSAEHEICPAKYLKLFTIANSFITGHVNSSANKYENTNFITCSWTFKWSKSTCPSKIYLPENGIFSYFSKKTSKALLMCIYNICLLQEISLFVLRFYGPVNPMGSCRARSVNLTTFTGQALSSKRLTSIVHIPSLETDNCPSWISGRERMTVENISWSTSTKECCRPRQGLNPRPPGLQSDGASNWATEAGSRNKKNIYNNLDTLLI